MQYGYNNVIIAGNISGITHAEKYVKFTIQEVYKTKENNAVRYHRCVGFSAELISSIPLVPENTYVCITGAIQYGSYQDQNGIKILTVDIVVSRLMPLGSSSSSIERNNVKNNNSKEADKEKNRFSHFLD